MFKENWSMKFIDWNQRDEADIENGQQKKFALKKDTIPAITEAPTLSFSDDGESNVGSTGGSSKLSTKIKVVRWYNNRGRVQKGTIVVGVILLCLVLMSVAIWAATDHEDAHLTSSSSSEAISDDRDFNVPAGISTLSPTVSSTLSTPDDKTGATDNIMDIALPTGDTTQAPDDSNTQSPADDPTQAPVPPSTAPPTEPVIYAPGHLNTLKHGLILSEGLDARIIAVADEKVEYDKKKHGKSNDKFHKFPSAGATFELEDGGWIYVSNSEAPHKKGGVGALTFDNEGNIKSYDELLKGTTLNKGGGKTPFGTWVSCEEDGKKGKIYQVDVTGNRKPEVMTMGSEGGSWESFAYDIRDPASPHFFVTEDDKKGALQRFTPENPDWSDKPWKMLHNQGTTEYLMLVPNAANTGGQFVWTSDRHAARHNAELYYPHTEGLDVYESKMYFVCKKIKQLFVLDLDAGTYSNHTTEIGLFDGTPDHVERAEDASNELLYFTEDSNTDMKAGVHARDHEGKFYTVLESEIFDDETTGLSFSPDGRFMYIAYQSSGLLYAVWRADGQPFHH